MIKLSNLRLTIAYHIGMTAVRVLLHDRPEATDLQKFNEVNFALAESNEFANLDEDSYVELVNILVREYNQVEASPNFDHCRPE